MIEELYCSRYGCNKLAGARRIENHKVVEVELVKGACSEDIVDEEGKILGTQYFCSIECCNKKDEFLGPEEIEDE